MTAPSLETLGLVSLSAAAMILAVLALRTRFQHETPRRIFCLLWDIVLIRLLILVNISSPLSLQHLLANWRGSALSAASYAPMLTEDTLILQEVQLTEYTEYAFVAEKTACTAGTGTIFPFGTLLAVIWLAGAAACAVWLLWGHLRSRRIYAASLPVSCPAVLDWQSRNPLCRPVQVRCSDQISSPLAYGVLYPVVLLPSGIDLEDMETLSYVLAHEYTHIRRFDALRKSLLALALCLHWFNPLVWVLYVLANRDIELACDEAVIRSGADRRGYALALLRLEEERGRGYLSGSSFSRNSLEERIEAIMKTKKSSLPAIAAVLVAMCAATAVFATSAPEPDPPVQTEAEGTGIVELLDGNNRKLFSAYNSEIWMDEDQYQAQYGNSWELELWTAEGYAVWLEPEGENLQDIIGGRACTE